MPIIPDEVAEWENDFVWTPARVYVVVVSHLPPTPQNK